MNRDIVFADLKEFEEAFDKDRANILAMNAVTSNGINASAKSPEAKARNQFGFSVEVEAVGSDGQPCKKVPVI